MKKARTALTLAAIIVSLFLLLFVLRYFGFNITDYLSASNNNAQDNIITDVKQLGYESVSTHIAYEQLSEEEKGLYDSIAEKITYISNSQSESGYYAIDPIVCDGTLSGYSVYKAVSAFIYENPDVFWLSNVYRYHSLNGKTTLELNSYVSRSECSSMSVQILAEINKFASTLVPSEDEYEREKRVFDYITANCSYDNSVKLGANNWKAYTIYGALVEGKAVCEGYSKAALKLLNLCGVNSILVNGYTAEHTAHMWNMVGIGGNWYHLDITGCDNDSLVSYKYFNLSDYQMEKNYIVSSQYSMEKEVFNGNFVLPKADDESQNYYKKEGFVLSGLGTDYEKKLSIEIISAAQKNKSTVHIYIDRNLDFSQTVSRLFSQYPYFFSKCLSRADGASRYSFDSSEVMFVYDEITRGISIKFFKKSN